MSGRGMNRRGHLSSKIPNVKLRPASSAAPSKKTREADPLNAMDAEMLRRVTAAAEDEDVSSAALRSTRKPWEKVVITFTGVDDKPRLSDLARQLGADIEAALTKETTHVVASSFGSAKYLYAVEHRIPTMTPEWIIETHAKWINAEDVDVTSSMEGKSLLPFTGLTISVSGVNAMDRRRQLIKIITDNGGTYAKDLDASATHLVSAQPTEIRAPSEKVKWAVRELKLNESLRRAGKPVKNEDIKIVYEDWIWDCVGYEGRWKEDWYDARKVRRPSRTNYEEVMSGVAKEKMQKAVKVEKAVLEEPALLKKRKRDAMDNLVGDIISTATGSGKLDLKPSRSDLGDMDVDTDTDEPMHQPADADTPTPASRRSAVNPHRKPSILHSSRTASFAGPSKLSRELRMDNFPSSIPATQHPARAAPATGQSIEHTFAGYKCTLLMLSSMDLILEALLSVGAEIVSEDDWRNGERVDYVIVRLIEHVHPDLSWIPEDERPLIVTDCWIEASVFEQRLLPLDDHVVFRPLTEGAFPIPGAERWCVHVAGYPQEQQVFIKRLLKGIGITYSDKLNKQATHLITAHTSGRKWEKAHEWGVAVMRESWLIAMGLSGQLEPDDLHRLEANSASASASTSTRVPSGRSMTVVGGQGAEDGKMRSGMEMDGAIKEEEGEMELLPEAEARGVQEMTEEEVGGKEVEADEEMGGMEDLAEPPQPLQGDRPASRTGSVPSLDLKAPVAASSPTTVALRKLKLAPIPTHIDPIPSTTDREHRSATSMSSTSFPLSPPKQETERLLNHATTARRIQSDSEPPKDTESIDSKLSRNSSAPVPITSSPIAPAARSTSFPNLGKSGLGEMLKLLNQPSDPSLSSPASSSRSTKPIRRPRNSAASGVSRLRTSMAYSTTEREGSEAGDMTVETTLRFSSSPPPNFGMHDGAGDMGFDESMRVNYVDPVAEKEKRRLFEAMRKGALKSAAAAAGGSKSHTGTDGAEEDQEVVKSKPKSKKRRT